MSPIPELPRVFSPRRPSSTAGLSPIRNASISRSSSSASSATGKNKKRSRTEEYTNDLPEDTTIIHSPQPATPPPTQSPEKSAQQPAPGGERAVGEKAVGDGTSSLEKTMAELVSSGRGGGDETGGETNGAGEQIQAERENSPSTDDLLVQLPDYDWSGFMAKFEEALKEIGAEREWLSKEYDMWNWMYDIWASSRDRDDSLRLSREMATIIQWTKLKEVDLERAREAHTQSMLAISSVLGIVPKSATPPPPIGKIKKR